MTRMSGTELRNRRNMRSPLADDPSQWAGQPDSPDRREVVGWGPGKGGPGGFGGASRWGGAGGIGSAIAGFARRIVGLGGGGGAGGAGGGGYEGGDGDYADGDGYGYEDEEDEEYDSDGAPIPSPSAPVRSRFIDRVVARYERFVPWVIFVLAAFTRFYRLSQPGGVCFDESHFVRFTNQYMARTYFFDIHPPLGKLTLWLVGQLVGLNSPDPSSRPFMSLKTDCNYEHISEDYAEGCNYTALRTVAAVHSTATVVLMYFIARNFGASVWGGILSSGLLLFDMLNNIQGRLVLLDVQLSFWCMAALFVAQQWWARLDEHWQAEDEQAAAEAAGEDVRPSARIGEVDDGVRKNIAAELFGATYEVGHAWMRSAQASPRPAPRLLTARARNLWCLLMGVVCANAFSVKMTGLVTPFLIAVESFFAIWFLRKGAPFLDLFKILVVAGLTYAFYFAVHFAILIRHGDGDEEFMTEQFQSTLLESKHYNPQATWEGFWWTFYTLNRRMIVHNANILAPHPWMSSWWEWVLNLRGVSYYGKDGKFTYTAAVYLIGNHAIHLGVALAILIFLGCGGAYLRLRSSVVAAATENATDLAALRSFFAQGTFCLIGYILNLAPYLGVARSTFIYHYMPALLYGELILARVIEHLAGRAHVATAAKIVLLVVGGVWLHFAPWIYGFELTNDAHARRRWMPRWD